MRLRLQYTWWALGACLLGGLGVASAQQVRDRRALRPLSTPALEQRARKGLPGAAPSPSAPQREEITVPAGTPMAKA